jgi:tetratricopeptide (TPR) repeat protein
MSTAVLTNRPASFELTSFAATGFWFVVVVLGQLALGLTVASFYGLSAARGNLQAWGKFISHGYVASDKMGNLAVAMHVFAAAIIMLFGASQLVPRIRSRFPAFHRWNGRIYMATAVALSLAGLYLTWIRGSVGGITVHMASTVNALLIFFCGAMALRYALARDFATHRRWSLRFFLVVSASWFFRIMFFLWLVAFGQVGFDPVTFTGPILTAMSYGQFLLPLALLEVYFWALDCPGAWRRIAAAGMLFAVSLLMAAGLFAVGAAVWAPEVKAAFDSRKSVIQPLTEAIAASGVDAAAQRYREFHAQPAIYNTDEAELNTLGYQLLRKEQYVQAIRIFQLNVEAYPQSSNVYDSLGEAYADDGNKPLAIVNYQKSLDLNPKNGGAVTMLKKLRAQ